jgi:hypothetical protein
VKKEFSMNYYQSKDVEGPGESDEDFEDEDEDEEES